MRHEDITAEPSVHALNPTYLSASNRVSFEIFVQNRFSQLELSSITAALEQANAVQSRVRFDWTFRSDTPGLVSNGNHMVRAEPVSNSDVLKDCLIVVGGGRCRSDGWITRVRRMQRAGKLVVLFSDAATAYAKTLKSAKSNITTHWRDFPVLNETGDFSRISENLAEYHDGIITCAGQGYALEATCRLVSDLMYPQEKAELASLLQLGSIRDFGREQPQTQEQSNQYLDRPLQQAMQIMEETIENPISISELATEIGVSQRQLERMFKLQLNSSPAKTYKTIRLKRARLLVIETRMSLLDIAIACGFSSTSLLTKAFRLSFGVSPKKMRLSA